MAVYGVFLIVMGLLGLERSPVSFYAGGGAGLIVLICAALVASKPRIAYITCAIVCLAVFGRFLMTFISSGNVYPHLIIVIASFLTMAILIAGHFEAQKNPPVEEKLPRDSRPDEKGPLVLD
ncbi:MAG: hypothetical protein HONBIEJF_02673 [Fimbriimonadaceae bacterium]|nr:hypothetical protein [Fimbriimonadaceae bacterium]